MGEVVVAFAPERNRFGVLDPDVRFPPARGLYNPMRVIADGAGCEAVFTLRRQPNMSDADFARDADTVAADLATLKQLLEGSRRRTRQAGSAAGRSRAPAAAAR